MIVRPPIINWTKILLIIVGILIITIIGILVYMSIFMKSGNEIKLEYEEKLKTAEREARDKAISEVDTIAIQGMINIDSIVQANRKIISVPYEKIEYRDRTLFDAVNILDSTEYDSYPRR